MLFNLVKFANMYLQTLLAILVNFSSLKYFYFRISFWTFLNFYHRFIQQIMILFWKRFYTFCNINNSKMQKKQSVAEFCVLCVKIWSRFMLFFYIFNLVMANYRYKDFSERFFHFFPRSATHDSITIGQKKRFWFFAVFRYINYDLLFIIESRFPKRISKFVQGIENLYFSFGCGCLM